MTQSKQRERRLNFTLTAMLGALAIVLAFLEGLLPALPFLPPGAKLGASNLVVLYAVSAMGLPQSFAITLMKSAFAFLTRGATAGLMSLFGGVFSLLVAGFLIRKTKRSWLLVSVSGALAHNAAQLTLARLITATPVWLYVPYLLIFSVAAGSLSALLLWQLMPKLLNLSSLLKQSLR